ncbi:MAG: aminotransferase class V-fold PLP-dependent enzyme [Gemmatimonas sp.]
MSETGTEENSAADNVSDHKALRERLRALEHQQRALHPGKSARRELRRAIVASSERFIRSLKKGHAFHQVDDGGIGLLDAPIAPNGIPIDDAVALLETNVVLPGANTASGGHLAYIPGSSVYHASLGDYYAAVTNKYAGIFFSAPGAVRMENMLLRWAADLVGYPATAGGNIASGGSIANLAAITAARDARGLKGADFARAVVYVTTQSHHCIHKALRIAGMAEARVRNVSMDAGFRMRSDALASAIAEDRRLGYTPWLVIASAGTTDTGAIDPLDAIGEVARREGCWYHVDAAYGGFFLLTAYGRAKLAGIELSDSVVLDPHKSLFLPYGSGLVLVRERQHLEAAHRYQASYMQDALRDASEVSPADVSPELTKHFRALRMWLPLIVVGTAPFAAALDEKLLLARYFRRCVAALGFEVGPEPDLTVVTYRWAPAGASLDEMNAMNRAIIEGSQRDGRVFLSSTTIDGRYTLRMVALSSRTHKKTIDRALRVLRKQVEALR